MTDILVLVGSLRAASVNRQIADVAAEVAASEGIGATVYEGLGDVPFYNEDLDVADNADAPAAVVALRDAAARADAVLVVTPEYNGTIPAVLKNAIDWLSQAVRRRCAQGQAAWRSSGVPWASTAACGPTTTPASRSASRARR